MRDMHQPKATLPHPIAPLGCLLLLICYVCSLVCSQTRKLTASYTMRHPIAPMEELSWN